MNTRDECCVLDKLPFCDIPRCSRNNETPTGRGAYMIQKLTNDRDECCTLNNVPSCDMLRHPNIVNLKYEEPRSGKEWLINSSKEY